MPRSSLSGQVIDAIVVQIFYFIGFGLFALESLLSIWVIQVSIPMINYSVLQHILKSEMSEPLWHYMRAASVHVLPRKWKGRRDEA